MHVCLTLENARFALPRGRDRTLARALHLREWLAASGSSLSAFGTRGTCRSHPCKSLPTRGELSRCVRACVSGAVCRRALEREVRVRRVRAETEIARLDKQARAEEARMAARRRALEKEHAALGQGREIKEKQER